MDSLSSNILAVLTPFSVLFSNPSWKKALTLLLGTLLCTGKRTVCAALRAMGLEHQAGFSKYHHLLNRAESPPLNRRFSLRKARFSLLRPMCKWPLFSEKSGRLLLMERKRKKIPWRQESLKKRPLSEAVLGYCICEKMNEEGHFFLKK